MIVLDPGEIDRVPFGEQVVLSEIVYSVEEQQAYNVIYDEIQLMRDSSFHIIKFSHACADLENQHYLFTKKYQNKEKSNE